jgi:hypothetical protein
MVKTIFGTGRLVVSDYLAWGGFVTSVAGMWSSWSGSPVLAIPYWGWWALAVVLLFVALCRSYWEREKNKRPLPDTTLSDAVQGLSGVTWTEDDGGLVKLGNALAALRENARLGTLSVWGRRYNIHSPLEPIPAEYWTDHHLDLPEYLKNERCGTTCCTIGASSHISYEDLYFNQRELDAIQPARKWKWAIQSPLVWREN